MADLPFPVTWTHTTCSEFMIKSTKKNGPNSQHHIPLRMYNVARAPRRQSPMCHFMNCIRKRIRVEKPPYSTNSRVTDWFIATNSEPKIWKSYNTQSDVALYCTPRVVVPHQWYACNGEKSGVERSLAKSAINHRTNFNWRIISQLARSSIRRSIGSHCFPEIVQMVPFKRPSKDKNAR